MFRSRRPRVLLLLSVACGALLSSGTASAACIARPLVLVHAAARTPVKLPAFLRATMICGADRGARGLKGDGGTRGARGADGAAGLSGATGARGADGTHGAPGAPGAPGVNGTNGAPGTNGTNGAPGTPGTNGINGHDGAPGLPATRDYAYLYDADGQTVAASGDVLFRTEGPMTSEFLHVAGSSAITFVTGGTFKVTTSIMATLRNQVGVSINGVSVVGATYGSEDNSQQNAGVAIISVAPGQVMTLRNQSTTNSIPLDNTAGGTAINVDASILLERLA